MRKNIGKKGIVFVIILFFILASLPISSAVSEKRSEETGLPDIELEDLINLFGKKEKKMIEKALDFGMGIYITYTRTGIIGENYPFFIPFIFRLLKPTGFVIAGRIECNDIIAATTVFNALDGLTVVDRELGPHVLWFIGPGYAILNKDGAVGVIVTLAFGYYLRSF